MRIWFPTGKRSIHEAQDIGGETRKDAGEERDQASGHTENALRSALPRRCDSLARRAIRIHRYARQARSETEPVRERWYPFSRETLLRVGAGGWKQIASFVFAGIEDSADWSNGQPPGEVATFKLRCRTARLGR